MRELDVKDIYQLKMITIKTKKERVAPAALGCGRPKRHTEPRSGEGGVGGSAP